MLSLQFIRENPEAVREALAKRRMEAPLDELLALDQERRRLLHEAETLRAERNSLSKEIGQLTRLLQDENAPGRERRHAEHRRADLLARSSFLSERLEGLEAELRGLEGRLERLLLEVPNLPDPRVPEGEGEEDNVIVRQWGEPRSFDFPRRPPGGRGKPRALLTFRGAFSLPGTGC